MTLIDDHRAAQLYSALGNPRGDRRRFGRQHDGGHSPRSAGAASSRARSRMTGSAKPSRASMKDPWRPLLPPAGAGRPADGDVPDRGDAGRRAQHEHLSGRRARAVDRTTSTRRRSRRRRSSTSKAICGMRRRRKRPARKAIKDARKAGTKVAFTLSDPFLRRALSRRVPQAAPDDLDIIFANEDEAKSLFEVEDFDTVLQAARSQPGAASRR